MTDVQTKPRKWKPDSDVVIKHDDLYARVWEFEYGMLIFDSDQDIPNISTSAQTAILTDLTNDEKSTIPIWESSPEFFPQAERSCDKTDTDLYI